MSLFDTDDDSANLQIGPASWWLRGFARRHEHAVMHALHKVMAAAPLREMTTPGGQKMSVRTTCCGDLGWVSDRRGYRYEPLNPLDGRPWPAMPSIFADIARAAARTAGFEGFEPDACLINQYRPGARMGLHQDRDERDFNQPIVSVSLGLPATFLVGGLNRSDRTFHMELRHGDIVVWGGVDRLRFHGVLPLAAGRHPLTGDCRFNLTLRKAG
jgi:alkylated DNA repair protein (DNA oxidative demethylase)